MEDHRESAVLNASLRPRAHSGEEPILNPSQGGPYGLPIVSTSRSALALDPSDGNQGTRNFIDAPLRSKQVELRCRISRVNHVHADSERAEVLFRGRSERNDLGADAENEKICKEPRQNSVRLS